MALPQRIERLTPADSDNPSAGAAEIRGVKAFIEDYFNIEDTVSYSVSPFTPEVTGRVNVKEYPYLAKGDGVTDDTAAIQAAIDVAGPHTVYFPTGTYILSDGGRGYSPWKVGMLILNREGITLEGPGTIRCPDDTVPIVIAGGKGNTVRGITIHGYWDTDAFYANPAIRIGNWADATSDTEDVWVDGVTFRNTPNDAVFIGGSTEAWDHISRNIRLTDNYVDEGLCFMLAVAVKGLTVDGLVVKHRTTVPPGPAGRLAQDEDIAVFSGNGVSSENIIINNITIDSRGTRSNPYTGYLKVHFGASTGLIMSNVVLSNITILDNIGTIPEISGWYSAYCSVEISDADLANESYTYSSYKNFVVSNLTLKNSGGLFCQCHGVQFNNVSIDTAPADWPFHAIASQTAMAASECVFTNTKIANWPSTGRIMSLEGEHITFIGLTVKDCGAELFASEKSTYSNFLIENSGNASNGAFYVQNGSDYVVLGPGVFKDCPYVALHDSAGDPARGGTLRDVTFVNNGTDFTINLAKWNLSYGDHGINVRMFGAVGDGVTDDTAAIQAAINAAGGTVYFPSGIYAISATLTLGNCTEVLGPAGGGFYQNSPAGNHLNTGVGAGLKWIGAASGTMVSIEDVRSVKWSGVDLDGMDYTDDVTGFAFTTTGAITTTHMRWQNFRVWNCGDAIRIGAGVADPALDMMSFSDFSIWICNNGFVMNSGNIAGTSIRNGNIGAYKKGIYMIHAGYVEIGPVTFTNYQNPVAGDAFIVIGGTGNLFIHDTQGEPFSQLGVTLSKHIDFVDGWSTYVPIILFSNTINWGVDCASTRKIISIGNRYDGNVNMPAGVNNVLWESHSDWYASGIGIVDGGIANIIQEFMPYFTGGAGAAVTRRTRFNQVVTERVDYNGVRTGAATPAGSVTPYFVGEHYIDTTAHKEYVADGLTNGDWYILN